VQGFRPGLAFLAPLGVTEADGRVVVDHGRALREPRVWLLGYGDWTGVASATLAGITRPARDTVQDIARTVTPRTS
jgi:putative flavoprotein involved in K+ transport